MKVQKSKVTHGWDIPVVAACTAADKVMDGAVVFVTWISDGF